LDVFTQRNFVADFVQLAWGCGLKLNLVFFNKKSLFEPCTFGGLRGNVEATPIDRWKARGRLPIRHDWTFFAVFYGWDVISGNLSKLAFFEGGGSL